MKNVEIYTRGIYNDTACIGGWAAVLKYKQSYREIYGWAKNTNKNRMELVAIANALSLLKENCCVTLFCDSQYIYNAIIKCWVQKWRDNNWMRNKKEKVLNPDVWEFLLSLCDVHEITPVWVQDCSEYNESRRSDYLATFCQ